MNRRGHPFWDNTECVRRGFCGNRSETDRAHAEAIRVPTRGGKKAAVVGDGAVGLCGVIAAKRLGAEQIIILGRHPARIDLAKAFGAMYIVSERGNGRTRAQACRRRRRRAKHGVIGLTKSAALDYASSNIRINAVSLGIIDTPMMDRFSGGTAEGRQAVIAQEPVGRMGTPEEIAAVVVFGCG